MEIKISNRTILRTLSITTVFVAFIFMLTKVSQQLIWLAIAAFLALALEPAVDKISRWMPKKSRGMAVVIVFVLFITVFSALLINLLPPVISQTSQGTGEIIDYAEKNIREYPAIYNFAKENMNIDQILSNKQQIMNGATTTGSFVFSSIISIFSSLLAVITILIFTFFLIFEGPEMVTALWKYQPDSKKERRKKLLIKMYGSVTGFVNGTLLRCGISGLVTTIVLFFTGIPYALSLGLLIAIMGIIPLVGGLIAATIITIIAFLYGGFIKGLIVLGFFVIYSVLENYIIQPLIFKKSVNISPFITCIAAIFGVAAGGFIGALIAIPVAASTQIFITDYLENRDLTKE